MNSILELMAHQLFGLSYRHTAALRQLEEARALYADVQAELHAFLQDFHACYVKFLKEKEHERQKAPKGVESRSTYTQQSDVEGDWRRARDFHARGSANSSRNHSNGSACTHDRTYLDHTYAHKRD